MLEFMKELGRAVVPASSDSMIDELAPKGGVIQTIAETVDAIVPDVVADGAKDAAGYAAEHYVMAAGALLLAGGAYKKFKAKPEAKQEAKDAESIAKATAMKAIMEKSDEIAGPVKQLNSAEQALLRKLSTVDQLAKLAQSNTPAKFAQVATYVKKEMAKQPQAKALVAAQPAAAAAKPAQKGYLLSAFDGVKAVGSFAANNTYRRCTKSRPKK